MLFKKSAKKSDKKVTKGKPSVKRQKSRPVKAKPQKSISDRLDDPTFDEQDDNLEQLSEAENDFITSDDMIRTEDDRQRFIQRRNRELNEQMYNRRNEIIMENSRTKNSHSVLIGVLVSILLTMSLMFVGVKLLYDGTLSSLLGIKNEAIASENTGAGSVVTITFDNSCYERLKELLGKDEKEQVPEEQIALDMDGNPILDEEGNIIPLTEEDGYLFMESSDGKHKFMQSPDGLYVTIDGIPYKVVDTDNGLKVINENDELVNIEDVDDDYLSSLEFDAEGNPYYHIVWGDTLCKISSMFHYSVDEIAEYNHIRNVNMIYANSDLRIPGIKKKSDIEDGSSDDAESDIKKLQKLGGDSVSQDNISEDTDSENPDETVTEDTSEESSEMASEEISEEQN